MSLTPRTAQHVVGLGRRVVIVAVGILMACLFSWVHAPSAKAFALFWAVALLVSEGFRVIRSVTQFLPEDKLKRFAGAGAMTIASVYYLRHGEGIIWMALSWIALLYGSLAAVTTLQKIVIDLVVIRALRADYRAKRLPGLAGVPFAYVISEPGLGAFHSQRFIGKMMRALWKYRSIPRESGLDTTPRTSLGQRLFSFRPQRAEVYFLDADCFQRSEKGFRDWLAMHACALLVVRASWGLAVRAFREEVLGGLCLCPGPVFDVCLVLGKDRSLREATPGTQYVEIALSQQRSMASLVALLTDRLVATAVPIGLSDQRLPEQARRLIFEIASSAVPPVAESYLRFRLAQSNVERFIALLDAYENLLKCSVIVLLAARWTAGRSEIDAKDKLSGTPTLGAWVHLLEKLLSDKYRSIGLDHQICNFWQAPSFQSQRHLVARVKKSVLPCPDFRESTQVGWINWMKLLRDHTKGHGMITESSITPFWHELHEIFLAMVSGLSELTLASWLLLNTGDEMLPLRGWVRQHERQELKGFGPPQLGEPSVWIRSPNGERLRLSPLVVVGNGAVLLWDGGRHDVDEEGHKKSWIEFVSFSSEKRGRVYRDQTAPHQLWANTARPEDAAATG